MSKRPSFQFYPGDWLSSERVTLMTLEEEGAYIRLLCYCWNYGSIPNDLEKVARLIGKGASTTLATTLVTMFQPDGSKLEKLIHTRMSEERKKQDEWRLKSSKGGKKSAKIKELQRVKGGCQMVDKCLQPKGNSSSSSSSSSSFSFSSSKRKKQNINYLSFEKWKKYTFDSLKILLADKEWIKKKQKYYPTLNIEMTIENVFESYFATEGCYKAKKGNPNCNWKSAMSWQLGPKGGNRVFKQNDSKYMTREEFCKVDED